MSKQAILIIAHNNLWTLKKIVTSLDSKYFDIYIHIDKKSIINIGDIDNICSISKLHIYKEIDIRWAHYSQVECELFLMKKALSNYNYSYFHLISGVDLPIKSNENIFNYFENSKKEFIHFETLELPKYKYDYYYRYNFNMKSYRKNLFNKMVNKLIIILQKILCVRINKNIKFYVGANWFSITNEFAKYVVSKEEFIYKTYIYSRSSDESFMQTLLLNSKFQYNLYNNEFSNNYDSCKRYIDWKRGNPYIFKIDDFNQIEKSDCYFARKFDENIDKEIINKIIESRVDKDEKRK